MLTGGDRNLNDNGGGRRTPRDSRRRQNVPDRTTGGTNQPTNNAIELDGVSHNATVPSQGSHHSTTTTAPAAASAAGAGQILTNAVTNAEYDAIDITSKRSQMITLMRKNDSKTNEFSFKAETVKELLDSVMGKADVIMGIVKEEKPDLSNGMYDALFAKFAMQDKKRPGKLQHCEKLVDIWLIFEQVEKLKGMGNGRGARSTNLSYFIETMQNLAKLVDAKMREDLDRLKTFKSELRMK